MTARIGAINSDSSMTFDDAMAWWRDGAPMLDAVMALDDATTRCRSDTWLRGIAMARRHDSAMTREDAMS